MGSRADEGGILRQLWCGPRKACPKGFVWLDRTLYRDQAVKPAALDLHIYERERSEIRRLLAAADAAATKLGVPLDINETYYDHADLFNELSPKVAGEELNSIRALLVFPRRSKSYCQIDVDAPYDMTSIGAAIGQCGQQR